ncbi:MAG: YcaO-like family protein, partial [Halobacteriota archaeon]
QLFRSNTNGLAAGNVAEEAIFHGLMEVIERDAVSIAEATRNPGLKLNPGEGAVADVMQQFESNDVQIRLWWLPTDTKIPTVVAVSDDERLRDAALLLMGAGSHTDPHIAALRALTEVAQSRATQIHGAREDTDRESIARRIGYERMKRLNKHWFNESAASAELNDAKDCSTQSLDDDIRTTLDRLRRVVERVIVADITSEKLALPAVRVIIPGFEVYFLDKERQGKRIKTWQHLTA